MQRVIGGPCSWLFMNPQVPSAWFDNERLHTSLGRQAGGL